MEVNLRLSEIMIMFMNEEIMSGWVGLELEALERKNWKLHEHK